MWLCFPNDVHASCTHTALNSRVRPLNILVTYCWTYLFLLLLNKHQCFDFVQTLKHFQLKRRRLVNCCQNPRIAKLLFHEVRENFIFLPLIWVKQSIFSSMNNLKSHTCMLLSASCMPIVFFCMPRVEETKTVSYRMKSHYQVKSHSQVLLLKEIRLPLV